MVDVGTARARLILDTKGFSQGVKNAEGQIDRFQKKSGGISTVMGGVAKAVKRGAFVAAGAMTALGASSIKTGMQFDKSMSQVAATLGKSTKDIKDLRDFAIEMGEKTKFSATEAADALNYMALAGYDSKKSMEMLPKVLSLAAAGNIDLAKASDMVTDAQTAFGISMDRTGQMVDEMAKAASTGNTSVEQMGDAFLVVGGLAKELNGGLVKMKDGTTKSVDGVQELEIALTAMANAGVKGSEAGTHMRNMLLKLSSPTKDGAEAFKRLGVSVFDSQGKMRSLQEIFGDLNTSMSKLTQKEKLQAISDIFNTRDTAASEALLASIEQDWNGIGESILDAKGAADKMAETQLDNLAGDITLAKSAFDSLKIAVSDIAKGPLRSFVQLGTGGIKEVTKAIKTGDFEGLFSKMGKGLSDLKNSLIKELPNIVKTGSDIAVGIGETFFKSLPTLLNNITESAFQIGETLISTLKDVLGNINISDVMGESLDVVGNLAKSIREKAGTLIDSGLELITKLAQGFADSIPVLIEKVPEIISDIAGIINDNAPKLLAAGVTIIAKLAMGLIKAIPTLVKNIPKIIKAIWDVFTAVNWVQLGLNIVNGIINGIKNMIPKLPGVAKNVVSSIWNVLKSLPSKLGTLAVAMIQSMLNGVKGLLGLVKNVFQNLLTTIIGAVKSLPSKFLALGKNVLNFLVRGVKGYWSLVVSTFTNLGNKIMSTLKGLPKKMLSMGKDLINGLVKGVKAKAAGAVDAIKGVGGKMVKGIKNLFKIHSPSKLMETEVGHNIVDGICKGIINRTKKGVKAAQQMSKDIYKAAVNKLETIRASKKYIVDADDEAKYWKQVMGVVKKVSDGYVSAYRKYQQAVKKENAEAKKAKETYNKEMTKAEKDYVKEVKQIYADLKKEVDELNAKYKEAYDNRVKEILSATSTFGKYVDPATEAMNKAKETYDKAMETFKKAQQEFAQGKITAEEFTEAQKEMTKAQQEFNDSTAEYTPEGLIANLRSQTDAIKKYNEQITQLEGKSILPPEMVEEIKSLGMDATGQIEAINKMTETQLAEFAGVWEAKYQLAEQQAEQELAPLKDATANAVEEATKTAEEKVDKLREKYVKKMKKLGTDGKTAGKKAGKNTVEGLIQGLNAKKGELQSTLSGIYADVKSKVDAINALMSSAGSGGSGSNRHSHRDGLNYVPYDGYRAQLHEGEKVLTKSEAEEYDKGSRGGNYNFTFNSPKAIDPYEANKLFKETVRKMNEGFA